MNSEGWCYGVVSKATTSSAGILYGHQFKHRLLYLQSIYLPVDVPGKVVEVEDAPSAWAGALMWDTQKKFPCSWR